MARRPRDAALSRRLSRRGDGALDAAPGARGVSLGQSVLCGPGARSSWLTKDQTKIALGLMFDMSDVCNSTLWSLFF